MRKNRIKVVYKTKPEKFTPSDRVCDIVEKYISPRKTAEDLEVESLVKRAFGYSD